MPHRITISTTPKDRSTGPNKEIEVEVDHTANLDSMIDRALETLDIQEGAGETREKYERIIRHIDREKSLREIVKRLRSIGINIDFDSFLRSTGDKK
jgi:hypothetical protein